MKYSYIILCLFVGLTLDAQDKKAKKVLDQLSQHYDAVANVSVDFNLVVKVPDEETTTYASSVIQSDNMFLFKNSEQEFYCDGEDIWMYSAASNEVEINDFDEDASEDYFMTPLDVLSHYKNGKHGYQVSDDRGKEVDIEFKPYDEFSDYSKIRITVIPKTQYLKQVIVFNKDASIYMIDINNIKKDITIDKKIFLFDKSKYPGVHIEDLRLD